MTRAERISSWLRERAGIAGAHGFVFGLSGGIDSAVVAKLCQMAFPQRVLGVILPCYSHPQDEEDARLVANAFSIPVARVDLGPAFDALTESLHARRQGPADARGHRRHQAAAAGGQRQAAAAHGVALLHRQLAQLSRGRHRQPERDHARLLHEVRRRRRRRAADRRTAEERSARARARARRARARSSPRRRPPACGSVRPTKPKWGSPTTRSSSTCSADASAVPAAVAERIEKLRRASDHKRELPPIAPVVRSEQQRI